MHSVPCMLDYFFPKESVCLCGGGGGGGEVGDVMQDNKCNPVCWATHPM